MYIILLGGSTTQLKKAGESESEKNMFETITEKSSTLLGCLAGSDRNDH